MKRSQFIGCIAGLAVGDALGYPAEFRTRVQLLREVGPEGITGFLRLKDSRFSRPFIIGPDHPPGTFTDDTQMTLAVAEALLSHGRGGRDALMQEMGRHFVAWHRSPDNNRAPGATCGRGCENLERGVPWREAGVAESKGCGSAMRVAPIGLFYEDLDEVESVARDSSLLTHGHPAALEASAAAALLVALALRGVSPPQMYEEMMRRCGGRSPDFDQCLSKVPGLLNHPPEQVLTTAMLGEGWVAEEAVASALYCFWRHPDDYRAAVLEAVNTDGDSDSLATITGSISGARLGLEAIPAEWVQEVERSTSLQDVGAQLAAARGL
ncbi:ADP-ribosylglycohydrolase family protein [Hyalangium sp.]|uniref:ADP-ribosylglycohydrolase family protein n=1 Tax=Hyalangium sp. TaxID=2028555 RepID=UPI002D3E88FD|nr:ADP-ribosylglycohydrolase family protein [Hyalangium sp.]HYH97900.1 ADP-ribosylglycohydrolase family protein [Hyalangium sp.]